MTADTQDASAALDVIEEIVALERAEPDVLLSELATLLLGLQGDSPYRPRLHRLLGVAHLRLKREDAALREFDEARTLAEGQSPPDYRELAKIGRETAALHAELGDAARAAEALRTSLAFASLENDPNEVGRIIAAMGRIELEAQNFDAVAKLYRCLVLNRAVSTLPPREARDVRADLCQALNRLERYEEALQQITNLREVLLDDDMVGLFCASLEEARALAGLGRHDEAEAAMVEAERLLPERDGAAERCAFIEALTALQELKGGPPAVESLAQLVENYESQGQAVDEVVARRALANMWRRLGEGVRAREALVLSLRQATRHGLAGTAEEIRADLFKQEAAHVEDLAATIDLIGGSDGMEPRFVRLRRLGASALEIVWLAADLSNGELVALKTADLSASGDAEREAVIAGFKAVFAPAAGIEDPRLVGTLSLRLAPGKAIYVTQRYIEGPTLRALYASAAPPERFLEIVAGAAEALAVLHAQGLAHRNLKPENVIVGRDAQGVELPVLIGLGVPLPADAEGMFKPLGTAPYMAPEQAEGQPGDFRADLYALGQMIAEVWGGKVPTRHGLGRLWHRETPDEMPRAIEEMLGGMLTLDPAQRVVDLGYVAEALRSQRQETAGAAAAAP